MELEFGPRDVRLHDEVSAYQGFFSIRRLTLSHRLFAGGWSEPLRRELFERGDALRSRWL